jgi:hypothetical protein
MEVFDRSVKRLQRDAAARAPGAEEFDYLRERVASVLVDRIEDISREFPLALDMGCHAGHIYKVCAASQNMHCIASKHSKLSIQTDISTTCCCMPQLSNRHTSNSYRCLFAQLVSEKEGLSGSGGVGGICTLVQCDLSEAALVRARQSAEELPEEQRRRVTPHFLQASAWLTPL